MTSTDKPVSKTAYQPPFSPGFTFVAVVCLLGLSALFAHVFMSRHIIERFSLAKAILVRDAIPWVLQYAAIALTILFVNRRFIHANRKQVRSAVWFPFTIGLIYWTWTIIQFPSELDFVTEKMLDGLAQTLCAAPSLLDTLYRFSQLLVSPFHVRGIIIDMQHWGFALAALSTTVVIGYWLFACKWIGLNEDDPAIPRSKQGLRLMLAMLVYVSPVILDGLLSILRLSREMQR